MTGSGWPTPKQPRLRPPVSWLRYLFPGTTQVFWIGSVYLAIGTPTLRRLDELGYSSREVIEICFITGHYQLLGMLEESAGMPPEPMIGWPTSTTLCCPCAPAQVPAL
jgi:hypothetical protein